MKNAATKGSLVIVSEIPQNLEFGYVYPPKRADEINKCTNARVRAEKYYAWELLRSSIERFLEKPMENIVFDKTPNGKWVCDECFFSISHSNGIAAVAVSDKIIGVDIECVSRHKDGFDELILSDKELSELSFVSSDERAQYVIEKWTQKESIFKTLDMRAFAPKKIETSKYKVDTRTFVFDNKTYVLSVCHKDTEITTEIFKN